MYFHWIPVKYIWHYEIKNVVRIWVPCQKWKFWKILIYCTQNMSLGINLVFMSCIYCPCIGFRLILRLGKPSWKLYVNEIYWKQTSKRTENNLSQEYCMGQFGIFVTLFNRMQWKSYISACYILGWPYYVEIHNYDPHKKENCWMQYSAFERFTLRKVLFVAYWWIIFNMTGSDKF